jgi:hypothetical protein
MIRLVRLTLAILVAVAGIPVLAQDTAKSIENFSDPKKDASQKSPTTSGGHLTTLSIFKQAELKSPQAAAAAAPNQPEALPPPQAPATLAEPGSPGAVKDSGIHGPAAAMAQPSSWWQRCKLRFWACLGFESEFEPQPLGASVQATYRTHVANGVAARMVLYHYDFVENTAALNIRGQDHIAEIAAMLPHYGFAVIIERTPSQPELAEARRLAVLTQLGRAGIAIPAERVVIGPPIANGLRGGEAEIIHQNFLNQTRERGLVTGAASGFVGAATSPSGTGAGTGGGAGSPQQPR